MSAKKDADVKLKINMAYLVNKQWYKMTLPNGEVQTFRWNAESGDYTSMDLTLNNGEIRTINKLNRVKIEKIEEVEPPSSLVFLRDLFDSIHKVSKIGLIVVGVGLFILVLFGLFSGSSVKNSIDVNIHTKVKIVKTERDKDYYQSFLYV
jgi:hypothetical protein